jgi:hypothetical protein
MTVEELIPVLQMAIWPVVLISGVGLLILSLTNRLGRVIDRGRGLASSLRDTQESQHPSTSEQFRICPLIFFLWELNQSLVPPAWISGNRAAFFIRNLTLCYNKYIFN